MSDGLVIGPDGAIAILRRARLEVGHALDVELARALTHAEMPATTMRVRLARCSARVVMSPPWKHR